VSSRLYISVASLCTGLSNAEFKPAALSTTQAVEGDRFPHAEEFHNLNQSRATVGFRRALNPFTITRDVLSDARVEELTIWVSHLSIPLGSVYRFFFSLSGSVESPFLATSSLSQSSLCASNLILDGKSTFQKNSFCQLKKLLEVRISS
jgi:hypothetical protein